MVVDLDEAFDGIEEFWSPHVAGELNGQHVKLARVRGEFDWHRHDDADELFFVHEGELTLRFRDRDDVHLSPATSRPDSSTSSRPASTTSPSPTRSVESCCSSRRGR